MRRSTSRGGSLQPSLVSLPFFVLAVLAMAVLGPEPIIASEWHFPHHDRAKTHHNPVESDLALPLIRSWTAPIHTASEPLAARGLVFTVCTVQNPDEDRQFGICGLGERSGDLEWRVTLRDIFGPFPAGTDLTVPQISYADGRVFVVVTEVLVDEDRHHIAAIDCLDGSEIWNRALSSWSDGQITEPPLIMDGIAYFARLEDTSSGLDGVFAFGASDGELLWSTVADDDFQARGNGQMIGLEGRLIVYGAQFGVALDPQTGARIWELSTPGFGIGTVAHEGEGLLISSKRDSTSNLYEIEARRKQDAGLAWSRTLQCASGFENGSSGSLVVSTDRLEMLCPRADNLTNALVALDPATGVVLAEQEFDWPQSYPYHRSILVKADGLLFTISTVDASPSSPSRLMAIGSDAGQILWSMDFSAATRPQAIAAGNLLIGTGDGLEALVGNDGGVTEWPSPQRDGRRTRYAPSPTSLDRAPGRLWSVGSPGTGILTSPIMAESLVFRHCRVPVAALRGFGLCAYARETGGLIWQRSFAEIFPSIPADATFDVGDLAWGDGRIYLAINDRSSSPSANHLAALQGSDGSTAWNQVLPIEDAGNFQSPWIHLPPLIEDGMAIFVRGGSFEPPHYSILAFSAETGAPAWKATPDDDLFIEGNGAALVLGDRLISLTTHRTVAFALASGRRLWERGSPQPHMSIDSVAHEGLDLVISPRFAQSSATITAHRGSTGAVEWTTTIEGHLSDLLVDENRILLLAGKGGGDENVVALDPATGLETARLPISWPAGLDWPPHHLIGAGDVLMAAGRGILIPGAILAFSSTTGQSLWTETYDVFTAPRAVSHDRLAIEEGADVLSILSPSTIDTRRPDLVAGPIALDHEPEDGEPNIARATISNSGSADAEATAVVWRLNGVAVGGTSIELAEGSSAEVTLVLTPTVGTHTLEVEVDPLDLVPEISEANNLSSLAFQVSPFPYLSATFSADTVSPNARGWYPEELNPVTGTVVASCPPSATETCSAPLLISFGSAAERMRFYHLSTHAGSAECAERFTGEAYSQRSMSLACFDDLSATFEVAPGESREIRFVVWLQPSVASVGKLAASWIGNAEDTLPIGQANIQPLVFLHGILGSMPPQSKLIADQDEMSRILDPFLRSYYTLLVNLQKMGYSWNETLFAVAYDWRQSNAKSAGFLAEQLPAILANAAAVEWTPPNPKADIVAHSMGGLVTRAYVQDRAIDPASGAEIDYRFDLNRVIFIATPHRGFAADYRTHQGMTWSDYLYGDGSLGGDGWQAILLGLTDHMVWPTLVAKHYQPTVEELIEHCELIDPLDPPYQRQGAYLYGPIDLIYCPMDVVEMWADHPDKGAVSLRQMLPTLDLDEYYFGRGGGYLYDPMDYFPHGRESNYFLEDLNASVSLLEERIGREKLFVIYGKGAEGTDLGYAVEAPAPPFWDQGSPIPKVHYETDDGDDLIPSFSLSLERLVDLPESQTVDLNAVPVGSEGGARHKEIVFHPDVQKELLPSFLADIRVPFATQRTYTPDVSGVLLVLAACPVDLMVTDTDGRRVGYDPASGTHYQEIPGAFYSEPGVEPAFVVIPEGESDDYDIVIHGYDDGDYLVRAAHVTPHGSATLGLEVGQASAGSIDAFRISLPDPAPPVAVDDEATTIEDTPVWIDVLANDFDPNADALAIVEASALEGRVEIDPDGLLIYTPARDFFGSDTLVYRVRDSSGLESTAEVVVTITEVNDPPVAVIHPAPIAAGPAPLVLALSAAASQDPDGSIAELRWDFGDGTTAVGEEIGHTYLRAGHYTLALTVIDDRGASDTATLPITVTGLYSALFVVAPEAGTAELRTGDRAVAERLGQAGFQVDWRDAASVAAEDTLGFDLVVISSTPASSAIGSKFRDIPIPVVVWEPFVLDDLGMTAGTAHLDFGGEDSQTDAFVEPGNLLGIETSGLRQLTSEPTRLTFGRAGARAFGIARDEERFERLRLFAYEAGDPMVGLVAPERRLFLPFSDETPTVLTAEGWTLFDAAICWAVHCSGEPLARFTTAPSEGDPSTLRFDGSLSEPGRDAGQSAVLVGWTWRIRGPGIDTVIDGRQSDFDFPQSGRYLVELMVTDSDGRTARSERFVQVGAAAYDALFVVGSLGLGAGDRAVLERLEALGADVRLLDHRRVGVGDADGTDLVLVSSTVDSELIGSLFRDSATPVLTWEHKLFDDLGMTGPVVDADFGRVGEQQWADFVSAGHPAAGDLSGPIRLFEIPTDLAWGAPSASATVIATAPGDPARAVLFVYESGSDMVGLAAPARRLALPFSDGSAAASTQQGMDQLDATLIWALGN